MTKYHKLGGLNNRHLSSHTLKARGMEGLVSSEASGLGLQTAAFSILTWPFLCVLAFLVSLCILISPSYKGTDHIG